MLLPAMTSTTTRKRCCPKRSPMRTDENEFRRHILPRQAFWYRMYHLTYPLHCKDEIDLNNFHQLRLLHDCNHCNDHSDCKTSNLVRNNRNERINCNCKCQPDLNNCIGILNNINHWTQINYSGNNDINDNKYAKAFLTKQQNGSLLFIWEEFRAFMPFQECDWWQEQEFDCWVSSCMDRGDFIALTKMMIK